VPSQTLPLAGRTGLSFRPTGEEAVELYRLGFRFSVFRPGAEECRLSLPFEAIVDFVHDTVTVRQGESAR